MFQRYKLTLIAVCGMFTSAVALSETVSALAEPVNLDHNISNQVLDKAQAFKNAFKGLADGIPKRMYDIDALAESLDYDIDKAIEFVKKEVRYDPYLGVMRGPKGTMISRAGSAWDQALLLSALISAMGGEFLIAEGSLTAEDSRRLIKRTFLPRAEFEEPISLNDIREKFNGVLDEAQLASVIQDWNTLSEGLELQDLAEKISNSLISELERNGIKEPLRNRPSTELVERVMEDYAWVLYRESPSSQWRNLHPAFEGSSPPKLMLKNYVDSKRINEKTHKLRIDLFAEIKDNGKFSEKRIIKTYERPIANLAESQVTVSLSSNTASVDNDSTGDYLVPLINGGMPEGAQALLTNGQILDANDMAKGPSIVATLGGKFANGLGAVGSQGTNKTSLSRVSGVILLVTYVLSDGTYLKQRRRIVDLRDAAVTNINQLIFQSIVDVNVGKDNGAYRLKLSLENLAQFSGLAPYQFAHLNGKLSEERYLQKVQFSGNQTLLYWSDIQEFRDNYLPQRSLNKAGFQKTAFIAMRRVNRPEVKELVNVMDILFNQTRAVELNNNLIQLSPRTVFETGIRQTIAEQAMNLKGMNFKDYVSEATLTSELSINDWANSNDVPKNTKERLLDDFNESQLLMPYKKTNREYRWWKINLDSGNSLGMSRHGGSQVKEYSETFTKSLSAFLNLGTSLGFLKTGYDSCEAGPASERACCHAVNIGLFAAGTVIGNKVQGLHASKWALSIGKLKHWLFIASSSAVEVGINVGLNETASRFSVCK